MTVKQTLKWIFGGMLPSLCHPRPERKIAKEEIKEAEEEDKQPEQAARDEVVKEAKPKKFNKATNEAIQEAKDEEELDFATALIDNFNNKL